MILGVPFLCIVVSFFIAYLGRYRKLGFWGYFFASLLLTPIMGALLVIVSDRQKRFDKKAEEE